MKRKIMEEKDLSLRIWDLLRDASVNTEFMMTEFSSKTNYPSARSRPAANLYPGEGQIE
jgi:hypothetical protein